MKCFILRLAALLIGLGFLSSTAEAQWRYPRRYGGYGMSQWGADPGAGYMAGLGAYARGQGVYQLDKAKADAINVDTMVKWNKALRARQAALREDKRKENEKKEDLREERAQRIRLEDGSTLNTLLFQIFASDPAVARTGRAKAPLSADVIREIPFDWDSEALTICIDQMTGGAGLPAPLMDERYRDEREALRAAVAPALKEDAEGNVSSDTVKRINDAVARFRVKFLKSAQEFELGYQNALEYFTTVASVSRLLNDPNMKAFLAKLQKGEERTIGDLITFMNSHNLRFGPAVTPIQIEIYERLGPLLLAIRDEPRSDKQTPDAPDRTGENLKSAAKNAFKGMSWNELEAHRKDL